MPVCILSFQDSSNLQVGNSLSSPGVNASPQWSESFRTPCPGISGSIFGLANGYVQFIDDDDDDDDDDDTTQKDRG